METTIIRVRKGLNGHRYSACKGDGSFIGNFDKLSEIHRHWEWEIRHGLVKLVRELDKQPDTTRLDESKRYAEFSIKRLLKDN